MIRSLEPADLPTVAAIWLDANREAHAFIPASYWLGHLEEVRAALARATPSAWVTVRPGPDRAMAIPRPRAASSSKRKICSMGVPPNVSTGRRTFRSYLSRFPGFGQEKARRKRHIAYGELVRAWGLEPQRIAAREPKGDVTLVKGLGVNIWGKINHSHPEVWHQQEPCQK